MTDPDQAPDGELIEKAIGTTIRRLREERAMSARALADSSGVSPAMISRIESGHVSPSIATMASLCDALNVPLSGLFQRTSPGHADSTFVEAGKGLVSTRRLGDYEHDFVNLAFHRRVDLQFEARSITVRRQEAKPPIYSGRGVLFIYVVDGEMIYLHGDRDFKLAGGDSLSIDAELAHGIKEVVTDAVTFLVVQSESR